MSKKKSPEIKIGNGGLAAMVLLFLFVGFMMAYGSQRAKNNLMASVPTRSNCLADDCLLVGDLEYPAAELPEEVQDALGEAINDEYKALTLYQKITSKFGMVRPFSMIMGAEEQHIASLKAIYQKYGLVIPANSWVTKISAPASLQEACQLGVDAEIANAKLYREELIPAVVDFEDISMVFVSLMEASEQKHLPAFEMCN